MLLGRFLSWYLTEVPSQLIKAARVLMLWIWSFFSVGFFIPRIFSPWHKDITSYGVGFDLKAWLHAFGWNLISRLIGAVLRVFFILTGFMLEVLAVAGSVLALIVWYASPILVGYLLVSGISGL